MKETERMFEANPQDFFSEKRLDLCVKYMYAQSIISGQRDDLFEKIYSRHTLHRISGRNPSEFFGNGSSKNSLGEYIVAFRSLIASMRAGGYDAGYPIPVMTEDGLIGNGAHRVAAACALSLPIKIERHDGHGCPWDFSWFLSKGFCAEDLKRILHCWLNLNAERAAIAVFWAPTESLWTIMRDRCFCDFDVVGEITIAFDDWGRGAFEQLVLDLYAHESRDQQNGLKPIERKCDLLSGFPAKLKVLALSRRPEAPADCAMLLTHELHELASCIAPIDWFVTCHTSRSPSELRHMADILLVPEYLEAIKLRNTRSARPEFLSWMNSYTACLEREQLPGDKCCIVGSSSLELVGIRESTDIDFTTVHSLRDGRYSEGPTPLAQDVDIVSKNYHRTQWSTAISDDELASNPDWHFIFRGYKFAGIDIVTERKDFSRRPKDVADVSLVRQWAASNPTAEWFHNVTNVRFRVGGNLERYAIAGISYPEETGAWTDGEEASLLLPTPRLATSPLSLYCSFYAFYADHRPQLVHVTVNDHEIATWDLRHVGLHGFREKIPLDLIRGRVRYKLGLRIADPRSPASLNMSADERGLGIFLVDLTVMVDQS
jgi:hypothetical protein